ncbi:hypothetical protein [Streptomyces sp. NPDC093149]|uniref:hypothetical protein n=1 Tax=Streptomyces sp. NPDC093149 TaxID=3366031 RepID=UPI0037FA0925
MSHLYRAIEAFGDDKDLVVEVRLADAERPGPRTRTVPSEYRVLPTGYEKSDADGKGYFALRVVWRGQDPETGADRWAVFDRHDYCLASDGNWEHEPLPSSRDENWLARCRFPLEAALRLAEEAVDNVKLAGRTFTQWEEHFASLADECPPGVRPPAASRPAGAGLGVGSAGPPRER